MAQSSVTMITSRIGLFIFCIVLGGLPSYLLASSLFYDDALRSYYRGQYDTARQQLEQQQQSGSCSNKDNLLLSLTLLKMGQNAEAIRIFSHVNLSTLDMGPYANIVRLIFLTATPFSPSSANIYLTQCQRQFSKSPFLHRIQFEVAKKALAQHNIELATTLFSELKDIHDHPSVAKESLKYLVKIHLGTQRPEQAKSLYTDLLQHYPDADLSETLLKQLRTYFPAFSLQDVFSTEASYLDCLRKFYASDHYGPTLYHGKIFCQKYPFSSALAEVKTHMAMSIFLQGNITDARPLFEGIITQYPRSAWAGKAWFYKARSYQRAKQYAQAKATYIDFITHSPSDIFFPEALFYLHACCHELGQDAEFAPFLTGMKSRYLKHPYFDKLIWTLAWQHHVSGNDTQALELLRKHPWTLNTDEFKSKLLFWTGKIASTSRPEKANFYFKKCLTRYPLSFYAYRLSQTKFLDAYPHIRQKIQPTSLAPDPGYLKLLDLGLGEWASEELHYALLSNTYSPANKAKSAYTLAYLYHQIGNHSGALQTLSKYGIGLTPRYGIISQEVAKLAYPRPYWDSIKDYSKKWDVDPYLVLAIMREESLFNPQALSRSGAIGLMQIMPATGEGIAKNLKKPWFGQDTLTNPLTNLEFGTCYVSYLAKRFAANKALMLSGYNAGPNITTKWATSIGEDLDRWIANIPYPETNGYVTRVLKSYWIYRLVYEGR